MSEAGSGFAGLAGAGASAVESTPMEPTKRPGGWSATVELLAPTGVVAVGNDAEAGCRPVGEVAGEVVDVIDGPLLVVSDVKLVGCPEAPLASVAFAVGVTAPDPEAIRWPPAGA